MSRNAETRMKQCDKCLIVQPCYEVEGAYLCAMCEFAVMTIHAEQALSAPCVKKAVVKIAASEK